MKVSEHQGLGVHVVDPRTIFTLQSPGWSLDDLVLDTRPRSSDTKLFGRSTKVTHDFKLLVVGSGTTVVRDDGDFVSLRRQTIVVGWGR